MCDSKTVKKSITAVRGFLLPLRVPARCLELTAGVALSLVFLIALGLDSFAAAFGLVLSFFFLPGFGRPMPCFLPRPVLFPAIPKLFASLHPPTQNNNRGFFRELKLQGDVTQVSDTLSKPIYDHEYTLIQEWSCMSSRGHEKNLGTRNWRT